MNSDLTSLSDLFNNSIFRIPDYQRGYAWEDSQLNDFWEGLLNIECLDFQNKLIDTNF